MLSSYEFYTNLDKLYQKKDFAAALSYMQEVQREAELDGNTEMKIAAANEIGAMYRVNGSLEPALAEYQNVLSMLKSIGMEGSKNYAVALVNLGNVYTAGGELKKSYDCISEAIRLFENFSDSKYEIAALNNNLSITLREMGRLKEAKDMALNAIEIINNLQGKEVEKATSYVNLGQIEAKIGDLISARKNLEYAGSIFESANVIDDFHYIVSVHCLAELDEIENSLSPALDGYKKARFLYEKNFGKNKYYEMLNKCVARVEIKLDEF